MTDTAQLVLSFMGGAAIAGLAWLGRRALNRARWRRQQHRLRQRVRQFGPLGGSVVVPPIYKVLRTDRRAGVGSRPRVTVLCHIYNEEFLLPFWLKHHLPLFDHGIVIDYASTDRSAAIVRELAPNWTLRPSRNATFGAHEVDLEVMDIERQCAGWKLVLNVTEFLLTDDLHAYLADFEEALPDVPAVGMRSVVMVDHPSMRSVPVTRDESLVLQRTHGYFDHDFCERGIRFIHQAPDGAYSVGRHGTSHPAILDPNLLLLWFGWSPYDQVKARKLQIQTRIPKAERTSGLLGSQHTLTPAQLDSRYEEHVRRSTELRSNALYSSALEKLRKQHIQPSKTGES